MSSDHHAAPGAVLPIVDDARADPPDDRGEQPGVALCLSGGGYRAMLFHLGCLIRLNELGQLRHLSRVSSVSGGSITAGVLGMAWRDLEWNADDRAVNLEAAVVDPVVAMAGKSIDVRAVVTGAILPFRTVAQQVSRAYDRHLFRGRTLRDLPDRGEGPRFVINATNVQTGKLVRFSRPYIADYTIGVWRNPSTRLADAVTASSAFPPVLSPHTVTPSGELDPDTVGPNAGPEFTETMWLSDGGVYDNLGLETAIKQFRTILVSDGGGMLGTDPTPKRNWAQHGIRVAAVVDGQVRALRKRQVIELYQNGFRDGTYWSVRSDVEDYGLADAVALPDAARDNARSVPTRLTKLDAGTRHDLVNWGYVIADTALRRHVFTDATAPRELPF